MAWDATTDAPPATGPGRPPLASQQSNSLPSTPYQHARDLSFRSRSPSPPDGNPSPRSTHSETTHLAPSLLKPLGGCKYETAMAFFRRRMPYTLGADLLPEEKDGLKEKLDPHQEQALTAAMTETYDRLLPSAESDDRRQQLVRKLEKLFNTQWPGHDIKVHVFGSSGNKLCSSDSDVDICITTTFKELEHVCLLAEALAKHGMERVVCVSHAKVPIVKIWDPELRLACDMNVNNTLALENTRMVRTYVEIDDRVRPLAMIVKYWTKQRILNAALSGTLSSYTWICLIVNFLQTRNPPILPSLQARPHKKRVTSDGLVCSFDDDLASLAGFGRPNKQTLGELLFEFFRYYGHEVDYEKSVISVREGKLISKEDKGWHLLQNNRLCVEEPFNTSRNLGNTADDTSFRGVHLELRRAFGLVAEGKLDECCEQYEYPPEEERTWEKPPPAPRPVLSAIPLHAPRGGRGGGRGGGRHSHQYGARGGHPGRRTSHGAHKSNNNFRHPNMGLSATDLSLQAQQAQYLLHDHLYQQIQLLQAQEQELRIQLQNQALMTGRPTPVLIRQPFMHFPVQPPQDSSSSPADENSRSRSGTVNHPPLTAPLRPPVYYHPGYLPLAVPAVQGSNTNPPSPSATAVIPDMGRHPRRSSVAHGSPVRSLRAQSQPARPAQAAAAAHSFPPMFTIPAQQPVDGSPTSSNQPPLASGSPEGLAGEDEGNASSVPANGVAAASRPSYGYFDDPRPSEYAGYYLGAAPHLQPYRHHQLNVNAPMPLAPFSAPAGFTVANGFVPVTGLQDHRPSAYQPPPGDVALSTSDQGPSASLARPVSSQQRATSRPAPPADRGPLIVDGSVPPSSEPRPATTYGDSIEQYATTSHCTSTSEDNFFDTPASVSDSLSQDLQDNSSLELDHPTFFARQAVVEPHKFDTSLGMMNGSVTAPPSLLSNRLQNLHLSNSQHLANGPTELNGASFPSEKSERDFSFVHATAPVNDGISATAAPVSPVTEFRNQPPTVRRRPNGVNAETVNGHHGQPVPPEAVHAPLPPALADDPFDGPSDSSVPQVNGHVLPASGENGHGDTTASQSAGGWQTTKRKHRRNVKSTSVEARHATNLRAEPLPEDESMRKGG